MNLYRAVRRGTILKSIAGLEPFYWVKARPEVVEFGSKYGSWGMDPTGISSSAIVASFGLGEDVTFESLLMDRYGCTVFGFDPTPRSIRYISENVSHPRFKSFPYALADRDGVITFSKPPESAADQVSASAVAKYASTPDSQMEVPCLTLGSVRSKFNIQRIDVLKMDIEGAEFAVIEQAVANGWLEDVGQVLVEFHHFLPCISPAQTRNAVSLLRGAGFSISWIGRTNHEYLFTQQRRTTA
jgi:FkbM family methyltransferase